MVRAGTWISGGHASSAHLKRIPGLARLRRRGPCGANDEFLLAATAQNLRKLARVFPALQQKCTKSDQNGTRALSEHHPPRPQHLVLQKNASVALSHPHDLHRFANDCATDSSNIGDGIQFVEPPLNRTTAGSWLMRFDMICAANEIEHRLASPNHPWRSEGWTSVPGWGWRGTTTSRALLPTNLAVPDPLPGNGAAQSRRVKAIGD